MTFPITPNPSIHFVPARDSGAITLQDVQWLEAQGANFINGIAQAVAKALLGVTVLGVQPLQALANFAADPPVRLRF
ncbi:hypothetical protein [Mycobacterium sp.]|uniref:hypothetical protein n=1 Tax=Mycobacterium sp. TaxID=1785 RepID=UPI003C72BD73